MSLFGGGNKRSNYQSHTYTNHENFNRQQDANDSYTETDSASNTHHKSKGNKKKIFGDDEGEYVDFEEQ